jgi:hypothetical protein
MGHHGRYCPRRPGRLFRRPIAAAVLLVAAGLSWQLFLPDADASDRRSTGRIAAAELTVVRHGSMTTSRAVHQATRLPNGELLVTGGCSSDGCTAPQRGVEVYDPALRTFRSSAPLLVERVGHAAVALADGRVLAVGGWTDRGTTASAELRDPDTGEWSMAGNMAHARGGPTLSLLPDGLVLVAGGNREMTPIAEAELFDPRTATFAAVAAMATPRAEHAAVSLRDGRVLVTGGHAVRRGRALRSAEIYDPATGAFMPTGDMRAPRTKHAAVLLADGRVLIIGGSDHGQDRDGMHRSTEIFDPATGRFEAGPDMHHARHKVRDAVVALGDGTVVVAGYAPEAELYDPRSGTFGLLPGRFDGASAFATASLLDGGDILVLGGYDDRIRPSHSAWLLNRRRSAHLVTEPPVPAASDHHRATEPVSCSAVAPRTISRTSSPACSRWLLSPAPGA